jgi:hypothetical protein
MRLRNKVIRVFAYTFAFGLVSISLLTRKSYAMNLRPAEPVPAQGMPKQEFQATTDKFVPEQDDTRQTDTITTALEGKALGSTYPLYRGVQMQDDVMRRTTSSNTSIGPKESGLLEEEASPQQNKPFKAVLEQPKQGEQVLTSAPEVQQMTGGVPGSSGVNPSIRKRPTSAPESSERRPLTPKLPVGSKGFGGVQTPTRTPRGSESGQRGSLSERSSRSGQYSLQPKRENCSPCSEPIVNCCQNLFTGHMSMTGRSPTRHAQQMGSFPRSSSPTLASWNLESSTSGSNLQWNNRPIADLLQEYYSKPTKAQKDQFYLNCADRVDSPKMNQFNEAVEKHDSYQREQAEKAALKRAIEIDRNIKNSNSHLLDDSPPAEGFPEETSRDYRAANYHENVPWQRRIVPNDGTQITLPDVYSYHNMESHTTDITMKHIRSQHKQVEDCAESSRKAQERGRRRLMEVAIANGNIRILPIGKTEDQSVQHIEAILEASPDCKFSAEKTTVARVKRAYNNLSIKWPKLKDTPISSSLPPNLFSIGLEDNVIKGSQSSNMVGRKRSGNTKPRPLKVLTASIQYQGDEIEDRILVGPDSSHTDSHYEAYNHDGVYLGKIDKDTLLLFAEAIPLDDRVALPKE